MSVKYLPRILDADLEKYLTMIGAILIVGPKWCGKTTAAEQHSRSVLKLQDKDNYKSNMMWADIELSRLLKGDKPRLIDEWQVAPVWFIVLFNSFIDLGVSVITFASSETLIFAVSSLATTVSFTSLALTQATVNITIIKHIKIRNFLYFIKIKPPMGGIC